MLRSLVRFQLAPPLTEVEHLRARLADVERLEKRLARRRFRGKRLRRELICIAARVTNHAHRTEVDTSWRIGSTSWEDHLGAFGDAWRALDALLAAGAPKSPGQ